MWRLICALIYVAVDVAYILISKGYYDGVVFSIQSGPMPSRGPPGIVVAAFAYLLLGLGWVMFVPLLYKTWRMANWAKSWPSWALGFVAGWFYAMIVYGVFNATLYLMFRFWDEKVVLRDMAWGTLWAGTVGALYAAVSSAAAI